MRYCCDYPSIAYDAAGNGRVDIIEYVHAKDRQHVTFPEAVIGWIAITECQMDALLWLRDELHYDFSVVPLNAVSEVRSERVDVVKFLLEQRKDTLTEPDEFDRALRRAAARGLYTVLEILLDEARACSVPVDVESVLAAACSVTRRSGREAMTLVNNQLGLFMFL
ncbi:hypothetical protein ATCC90586_002440 [Pythium insidiosum]|nr:hypothetical protein ATCC90586_002440 [Pythium insidiosum]